MDANVMTIVRWQKGSVKGRDLALRSETDQPVHGSVRLAVPVVAL